MDVSYIAEEMRKAALDPQHWEPALATLASVTNSYRGQLLCYGSDQVGFNIVTSADEAMLRDVTAAGSADPQMSYRVASAIGRPVGEIVWERDYRRSQERLGHTVYQERCEEYRLPFGCQTVLASDGMAMVGMALLRSREDGPTTQAERDVFDAVIPHAQAAVRTQALLEGRGVALVGGALDAVGAAAVLIDPYGRVMRMTPPADALLRNSAHLDVRGGVLRASNGAEDAALSQALARVLLGEAPEAQILLRGAPELPLNVAIQRLPEQDWNFGFRPRAVVVLRSRAFSDGTLARDLQQRFGLTLAEADVAVQLRTGASREQIAERRGASIGTVRQQVKSIFAKLGVRREAECIALLALLAQE